MGEFKIVTLGNFICQDALQVAMESFSIMFDQLTNKYLKKINITLIDKKLHELDNKELIEKYQLKGNMRLVHVYEQEKIIEVYETGSVLFIPCQRNLDHIFKESFSYGLPVLTFDLTVHEEFVDHTSGLLVDDGIETEVYANFANKLQLLLFDPDARMMLRKGAKNKYENEFSWGTKGSRGTI